MATESNRRTWAPLPKADVVAAIERTGPPRIPLVMTKWWGEGMVDRYGSQLDRFDIYPHDATILFLDPIRPQEMGLSWEIVEEGAHDARAVVDDWSQLDEFIEKLSDPETDPQIDALIESADQIRAAGQYVLVGWWRLFFERPWAIRGMTNLLMDYHLYPDEIHRMHEALCQHYIRYIDRVSEVLRPDGFWTSDDLGHQRQLFMSPTTYREMIKPYYARVGECVRRNNLHWWLHSCGNNTAIMDDLIEVGVNVFHPVQKGTMDEVAVAREFGDRMTFLAGFDVQHILPEGTPEQIRAEVRHLINTFDRPDGGLCLAAGNGILPDTRLENIEAFLDEVLRYGEEHRQKQMLEFDSVTRSNMV